MFRALVRTRNWVIYRPPADILESYKHKVPSHLLEDYEKSPAAMLRLLESWLYVNGESTNRRTPTRKDFLLGSKPNWSLIAQGRRFTRDIEDELWEWDDRLSLRIQSQKHGCLGDGARRVTAFYNNIDGPSPEDCEAQKTALSYACAKALKVNAGDVAYAATLFSDVPCYFVIDQAREHTANVHVSLTQQRKTDIELPLSFSARDGMNGFSSKPKFHFEGIPDIEPLTDGEIKLELLDFLGSEERSARRPGGKLDRSFSIQHRQE